VELLNVREIALHLQEFSCEDTLLESGCFAFNPSFVSVLDLVATRSLQGRLRCYILSRPDPSRDHAAAKSNWCLEASKWNREGPPVTSIEPALAPDEFLRGDFRSGLHRSLAQNRGQ